MAVGIIPGGLIYVFADRRHLEELFLAARKAGLLRIDLCIWNKQSGGAGRWPDIYGPRDLD